MKTRILVCLLFLGLFLNSVAVAQKKSGNKERPPDPRIVKIYNDFSRQINMFERNAMSYTYADTDILGENMAAMVRLQTKTYIAIKQIDTLKTKYTSLVIRDTLISLNEIGLGMIDTELDNIHQMAKLWDNKKGRKERTNSRNLMNWKSMSDRLLALWNLYYSWDTAANSVAQRTNLYPEYCLFSKSMQQRLADHKLALNVLYDSWVLDKANILAWDYSPFNYELKK